VYQSRFRVFDYELDFWKHAVLGTGHTLEPSERETWEHPVVEVADRKRIEDAHHGRRSRIEVERHQQYCRDGEPTLVEIFTMGIGRTQERRIA
jgi:hypothetical protein